MIESVDTIFVAAETALILSSSLPLYIPIFSAPRLFLEVAKLLIFQPFLIMCLPRRCSANNVVVADSLPSFSQKTFGLKAFNKESSDKSNDESNITGMLFTIMNTCTTIAIPDMVSDAPTHAPF